MNTLLAPGFRHRVALCAGLVALVCAVVPLRAQDAAEIILRLDRLEAENRRLTGQLDELRFQLRRMEEAQKRFETDADLRFRDLEGKGGTPRVTVPTPQGGTAPQRRSDAFDPNAAGTAPGAPRPLGATPPSAPLAGGPGQPAAGTSPPAAGLDPLGAPLDVTGRRPAAPQPVVGRGDAASDYAYAKTLVDRGDYELAEGAFRDFLRAHGKDRRVAEATFFLGESYLRRTRYREAAEQFLNVTSKYGNAPRAAEAMLKLGISLRGLGANQEACGTFAQVGRKYPNASAEIRQAVEREKARAQC